MGRWPYCLSRMEVNYCTFGFGVIIQCDLCTLSLPRDSPHGPLFFFPKIYDPHYIWDPHSEENDSPLITEAQILRDGRDSVRISTCTNTQVHVKNWFCAYTAYNSLHVHAKFSVFSAHFQCKISVVHVTFIF